MPHLPRLLLLLARLLLLHRELLLLQGELCAELLELPELRRGVQAANGPSPGTGTAASAGHRLRRHLLLLQWHLLLRLGPLWWHLLLRLGLLRLRLGLLWGVGHGRGRRCSASGAARGTAWGKAQGSEGVATRRDTGAV